MDSKVYNWFIEEVSLVKTNKFFVFRKDVDPKTLENFENEFGILPEDYRNYLLIFGNSSLFRNLERDSYNMEVVSCLRPKVDGKKNQWLEFGYYINGGIAYFKMKKHSGPPGHGVYEGENPNQVRKIADSFEEWLKKRFETSKRLYKKREWKEIVAGPAPFTEEELKIVEAIPLFDFKKVGVAANEDLQIQVHNGSKIRLEYLTVGVVIPGQLEGAIGLKVGHIGPGETIIVERGAYKATRSAKNMQLFRKPIPEPSERRMYYEFNKS